VLSLAVRPSFFFNKKIGVVKIEAGILLDDLLKIIIPQGWFIPVSPGTKFVTLGGMVEEQISPGFVRCLK
jgi:FAD/FMN-containing dehydrogenase